MKKWDVSAIVLLSFIQDDFFAIPFVRADKGKLHLEARYNFEDLHTFSGWIGYNFEGGNAVEFIVTPMAGIAAGRTNGIAPGFLFTLNYKRFQLYSESEYLFDLEHSESNFFLMWTDFIWFPNDWFFLGISSQKTRVYDTKLDFQRGLLLGGIYKNFALSGYSYNPFTDDDFFLVNITFNF